MGLLIKVINVLILFCFLAINQSCASTKYKPDEGFMLPSKAGALEYLVYVNGLVCKDLDGNIGACTKTINARDNLKIKLPIQPYSYRLSYRCSSNITYTHEAEILKKKAYSFSMPTTAYKDESSFMCIGTIIPADRQFISMKFEVRVRVVSADYVPMGSITTGRNLLYQYVFAGKYAYYIKKLYKGKWKFKKKDALIRIRKSKVSDMQFVAESYSGRLAYLGF